MAVKTIARACAEIAKWYDEGGKIERAIRTHFNLKGIKFEQESPAMLDYIAQFESKHNALRAVDMALESVLLVGLTERDFERFEKHGFPYSGSTGHCDPSLYPGIGPYIATFVEYLPDALKALRWKRIRAEIKHGQLRVGKK